LTPESLHALRRKLLETQKLHAALAAEKTRNDAQIARLRSLLAPATALPKHEPRSSTSPSKAATEDVLSDAAPFDFLTHTQAAQNLGVTPLPASTATTATTSNGVSGGPEPGRTPLTTHTTFTTSQLPALRTLLASLKPHLATAALPGQSTTTEKDEWDKERRVYVESQSKRVLERRGVDTRDGVEGVVEGSRVRSDEVSALEGIVAGLGGRREGDTRGGDVEDVGDKMDTS
jgi:kinetochore protein Mis12/MTW1